MIDLEVLVYGPTCRDLADDERARMLADALREAIEERRDLLARAEAAESDAEELRYERGGASEKLTLQKGLTGAKSIEFCRWVLDLLNAKPADAINDLFPGHGNMRRAIGDLGAAVIF